MIEYSPFCGVWPTVSLPYSANLSKFQPYSANLSIRSVSIISIFEFSI